MSTELDLFLSVQLLAMLTRKMSNKLTIYTMKNHILRLREKGKISYQIEIHTCRIASSVIFAVCKILNLTFFESNYQLSYDLV